MGRAGEGKSQTPMARRQKIGNLENPDACRPSLPPAAILDFFVI
jgi:hypothetical protein